MLRLLVVLVAVLGSAASTASAATVALRNQALVVTARAGERNAVTLRTVGADVRVSDRSRIPGAAGCRRNGPALLCPVAGLNRLVIDLQDRDDSLTIEVGLPATVAAGAGNDTVVGSRAPDRVDGGPGTDRVSYSDRGAPVTVTLGGGADDGEAGEGDELVAVEEVLGTAHSDVLRGSVGADRLHGAAGDDLLDGGPGDDLLVGGFGADRHQGGLGNDTFGALREPDGRDVLIGDAGVDRADYGARTRGVAVDADGRPDDGDRPGLLRADGPLPVAAKQHSAEADNVMPDVETVLGGSGDDVLAAAQAAATLAGQAGTDVLVGGPAADQLDGGAGFDRLLARDGVADRVLCGTQTDQAFIDAQDRFLRACELRSADLRVGARPLRRRVEGATVRVRMSCPAHAARRCVGSVRLTTLRRLRSAAGRRRAVELGAARFNTGAGVTSAIAIRLSAEGREALRRFGGATRVRLVVRARDEVGAARPSASRFVLRD